MNKTLLKNYIDVYVNNFREIHNKEIYKWQAVKQFQENWDPNASDFTKMFQLSISKAKNLMDAGKYYPRRMIIKNSEKNPIELKTFFLDLFDEEIDVLERINVFKKRLFEINSQEFPRMSAYQDHRAIIVYLTLKYPEVYYFYKYGMLKDFCIKIEHNYKPKPGESSNIIRFFYLCSTVREELIKNNDLIKLHKNRLGEKEYFDVSFNILTQDFIYAVTKYLTPKPSSKQNMKPMLILQDIQLEPIRKVYILKGRYVDYESQNRRNKNIGDLGEEFVLSYEKLHCNPKYLKNIIHSSKTEGDGLGYDILSYNENGNIKYIEVKTTKGGANQPFYISGNELECSKIEGDNYFLYRIYNFDRKKLIGDLLIIQGDLSEYCKNATQYEVVTKIQ